MKIAIVIIDASVAFKWLARETDSDVARRWISRDDLVAPVLLYSEVGNALRKQVARGELSPEAPLGEQLADLADILMTVDESSIMPRALQLAIELRHPIYDCVYLALAEAMDQQVLTADHRFIAIVGEHPLTARLQVLA